MVAKCIHCNIYHPFFDIFQWKSFEKHSFQNFPEQICFLLLGSCSFAFDLHYSHSMERNFHSHFLPTHFICSFHSQSQTHIQIISARATNNSTPRSPLLAVSSRFRSGICRFHRIPLRTVIDDGAHIIHNFQTNNFQHTQKPTQITSSAGKFIGKSFKLVVYVWKDSMAAFAIIK